MARPDGSSQGASDHSLFTFPPPGSRLTKEFRIQCSRNIASVISSGKFRFAAERNRGYNLLGFSIDDHRVAAAAIEGPHALPGRLVDNAVRILPCFYLLPYRIGLEIKYHDNVVPTVRDEAFVKLVSERDAVDAFHACDAADLLTRIEIHNLHFRAVRYVKLTG